MYHPSIFFTVLVSLSLLSIPSHADDKGGVIIDPLVGAETHTLDWPVGLDQAVEFASGPRHNPTGESRVVYDQELHLEGAAWLQVHFGVVNLEGSSFIRMTSLLDGEVQELDAANMMLWQYHSAYFNGNTLRIELVADPATFNNEFTIDHVSLAQGFVGQDRGDGCGICGSDSRTPSSEPWVARLMPVGCTASIYDSDNCFVTAGHCLSSANTLQFNVPDSSSNCSLNNPPIADQFPVLDLDGVNQGVGADYGALKAGSNNLGQTPYERYNAFLPIASSIPTNATLEVWGHGTDDQCVRNQIQQYHSGDQLGLDSNAIYYDIDITYGNSGSSIIHDGEIVGIVTHCSFGCENYGSRIDINDFEDIRNSMCSIPVGACCVETSCAVILETNCGGTFLGDGTDCSSNPCAPSGACCIDETCSISIEDNCAGTWFGAGSDCSLDPCAPEPPGACCTVDSCAVIDKEDCSGNWLGENTDCTGDPCSILPTGACCVNSICSVELEADCGGSWLGAGSNCGGTPCSTFNFQGIGYQIVGTDLVDDASFTWTVDVYVILNSGERLDAVAGDANQSKTISTTTSFYQNQFGGATSTSINSALFSSFPDVEYDSFITLGRLDSNDNEMNNIGIDFASFEAGGTLDSADGSWYVTPDDAQGEAVSFVDQNCNQQSGALIARLTVRDENASVHIEALFQGKDGAGATWQAPGNFEISWNGEYDCNGNGAPDHCDIADGTSIDSNDNGIPDECEDACPADFDGNGIVNIADLLFVIANWSNPYDVTDLLLVISDWNCSTP